MAEFTDDAFADPLTTVLNSRRSGHGKGRGKGRGRGGDKSSNVPTFNPIRALGYYEVRLGSKSSTRTRRQAEHESGRGSSSSWLELHELTEQEDGFIGTLHFDGEKENGYISGMCLLAGSRKGLQEIVDALEREGNDDVDEDEDEDEYDGQEADIDTDTDDDDENDSPPQSAIEASDEKINRRFRAFEKNSFRNPKFWVRWKGHVHNHNHNHSNYHNQDQDQDQEQQTPTQPSSSSTTVPNQTDNEGDDGIDTTAVANTHVPSRTLETNSGYLIFTTNACDHFEGTVSCSQLGWDNLKMQGWRRRARAGARPPSWTGFM